MNQHALAVVERLRAIVRLCGEVEELTGPGAVYEGRLLHQQIGCERAIIEAFFRDEAARLGGDYRGFLNAPSESATLFLGVMAGMLLRCPQAEWVELAAKASGRMSEVAKAALRMRDVIDGKANDPAGAGPMTNDEVGETASDVLFGTHNPHGLTREQVEVAEGWRLLDRDEVLELDMEHEHCEGLEYWVPSEQGWQGPCYGDVATNTYRTKAGKAELLALRMRAVPSALSPSPSLSVSPSSASEVPA